MPKPSSVFTLAILASYFLNACGVTASSTARADDQEHSPLQALVSRLAVLGLLDREFTKSDTTDRETEVKAEIERKILRRTVKATVGATLLQSYSAKIHTAKEESAYTIEVTEIVRLGEKHHQLSVIAVLRDIDIYGQYTAKLKSQALGDPEILDLELAGKIDVRVTSTLALQWQRDEAGDVVFEFVPIHELEEDADGNYVSRGVAEGDELVRLAATVERFAVDSGSLDQVTAAITTVASKTDAAHVRDTVNDLFKDAANAALAQNQAAINEGLLQALVDANAGDKAKMEDYLAKAAVAVLLR